MRNLVTVRTIGSIRPIENADAIECATVDGWQVVTKKGEFAVGDKCVYFEIDSFLPIEDERFAFLAKNKILWNERIGIRLRTIKLRGQISQGLILPLSAFPEVECAGEGNTDLAELLNIVKWEVLQGENPNGIRLNPFPSFIQKTDQERIQNVTRWLIDFADAEFEVTIKLDGSSMTVFHNRGEYGVCSRNCTLDEFDGEHPTTNKMWTVAKQNNLIEALKAYGKNIALQGELIGEGIQGNPEKITGQRFYLFDIFDIDAYAYLTPNDRYQAVLTLQSLGAQIEQVPMLCNIKLAMFGGDVANVLGFAEGKSLNPNVSREGVVFKSLDGAVSFKAISNSYLLKHADR